MVNKSFSTDLSTPYGKLTKQLGPTKIAPVQIIIKSTASLSRDCALPLTGKGTVKCCSKTDTKRNLHTLPSIQRHNTLPCVKDFKVDKSKYNRNALSSAIKLYLSHS